MHITPNHSLYKLRMLLTLAFGLSLLGCASSPADSAESPQPTFTVSIDEPSGIEETAKKPKSVASTTESTTTVPESPAPTTTTAPVETTLPPMTPLERAVYDSTGLLPGEGDVRVINSMDDVEQAREEANSAVAPDWGESLTDREWKQFFADEMGCAEIDFDHLIAPGSKEDSFACASSTSTVIAVHAEDQVIAGRAAVGYLSTSREDCTPVFQHDAWVFVLFGDADSAGNHQILVNAAFDLGAQIHDYCGLDPS